jgi:phosphotransferase system IIA component
MKRIEDLFPSLVTADMRGDGCSFTDHFDTVHIPLHAHLSKRPSTRHTVAVAIEADRLILVHLARLGDTRIEAMSGKRPSSNAVLFESLAN